MKEQVVGIIPARLDSKRFPRKVAYSYRGKPLLFYVWKSFAKSKEINRLIIATDSDEVCRIAEGFGAEVMLTSGRHRTGSDRAAEVMGKIKGSLVVNIQADNFGLKASVLDKVIGTMKADRSIQTATLARRIDNDKDLVNPDVVKVVTGTDNQALWFSRYPIPYIQRPQRGSRVGQYPFLEHIGIYFYRRKVLEAFAGWKRTQTEKTESLEQLRVLENGVGMRVFVTRAQSVSVDAPEDLKKLDDLRK